MQARKDAPLPNYPKLEQFNIYACVIFVKQKTTSLGLREPGTKMKTWIYGFEVSTINYTEN